MDSDHNRIGVNLTRHVDRFSSLPDDVITNNILSLLPTRDSVRTSALSTRWKYLYALVPVLDFQQKSKHSNQLDLKEMLAFAGFVSKVLNTVINKLSRISMFSIDLKEIRVSRSDIISWIEKATSHSVQRLSLYSNLVEVCAPTPHCLFTCKTLVSLSLGLGFELDFPDKICLPKLKSLWLKNFTSRNDSEDESLTRLFSSCPVLESLTMISSFMRIARVLNVSVPSLKVLRLYLYYNRVELAINCPNLEELDFECDTVRGYSGDVLGSLRKCKICVDLPEKEDLPEQFDFPVEEQQQFEQGKLIEMFRQICEVQFLSLAGDSLQDLLNYSSSLPTFKNLTHLELESNVPIAWKLLPVILDSSPCLKSLLFKKGFFGIYEHSGNQFPPPEYVPVCLSLHLKVIRIDRFLGEEIEFKWVEYFLTHALVLEKMEVCVRSSEDSEEENDSIVEGEFASEEEEEEEEEEAEKEEEEEGRSEIIKRLLSYQRSSEVCQIILPPDY